MNRRRGRGRGLPSIIKPSAITTDSRTNEDVNTGPPPLFPEMNNLPSIPDIDTNGEELLVRWHKYRHVCRSGPYFLENPHSAKTETIDKFSVKKYSDKEISKQKRPRLTSAMTLSPHYFPVELSSQKERKESANRDRKTRNLESVWSELVPTEKDIQKFDDAAKTVDADKKDESEDEDANDGPEDKGEDEYSQDDYQQGEYFDDDEEYEDLDDAGDGGPVY